MRSFEIFFNDLNEDAQNRLLKLVGVTDPKEMNWDMNIVPIAIFDIEVEEEE